MTRLAYRTALSLLLAAFACADAALAAHGYGIPAVLSAVAAGYLSVLLLAYACGAAFHVGRAEACGLVHRERRRPSGRRVVPGVVIAEQHVHAGAEERQHAAAVDAIAVEPMATSPSPAIAYTTAMPAVGGVVWRFDGGAVGNPAPGVWTAPVGAAGRHAGAAASDLSEWGAFEYARPQ